MKKNKIKNTNPRHEWKSEVDEIKLQIMEEIDELELPKETVGLIEKTVIRKMELLKDGIDEFKITPEIADKEDDLLYDWLSDISCYKYKVSEDCVNEMVDIVKCNINGGYFIEAPSLAEQMKVEAFLEDLKENPYQLKLIA